jgi:hypothetical protein
MLPFFPTPYPDELLYSVCARYHQRSCNLTARETLGELFGSTTACAVWDLPSRLDSLCKQVSGPLTSERLIDENTLLPAFRLFLPGKRLNKLISWMKGDTRGGSIHLSIGAMASAVPTLQNLRYCPQCLASDHERYGETYWHRSHQFPGVLLCHRHDTWLEMACSLVDCAIDRHTFKLAPDRDVPVEPNAFRDERHLAHYQAVAKGVAWLLHNPQTFRPGLLALQRKFLRHLHRLELASYSGRVKQQELLSRFIAYYGEDFLDQIHCHIGRTSEDNWLSSLVRKPRGTAHPLRYLLLIHFLGLELEDLFLEDSEQAPFGRSPWPCLNPAASHYRRHVVRRCVVTRHSETGFPIGKFFCDCGFAYARTGPDRQRADRFRRGRLLNVGPIWEEALLRLVTKDGCSLRAVARELGVDVNTVSAHLARLKAGMPEEVQVSGEREEERGKRRRRWQKLLHDHLEAGRSELIALNRADYFWLRRNDQEWLSANLPEVSKCRQSEGRRVDWARRDTEIAPHILAAAREIRFAPGRPMRITVSALGRKINSLALLQRELEKLPETRKMLKKVVESREAFSVRRVRLAASQLLRRGEPLQAWRIVREARLRPGYGAAVEAEILRILSFKS